MIAPEASTHWSVQGDFIPTMSLGIPGDAVMALILGAGPANFARAADTPHQGGTIVVTYQDDMATLDPAIGYDWTAGPAIK